MRNVECVENAALQMDAAGARIIAFSCSPNALLQLVQQLKPESSLPVRRRWPRSFGALTSLTLTSNWASFPASFGRAVILGERDIYGSFLTRAQRR